jgi:nucleoside-diphosphate-sugar epimerase
MKILVTGSNGFVGSHLCLKLLNDGHTVYGLVRTPSKMCLTHSNFIMVPGDLNQSSVLSWIKYLPSDLDACIHTAGLVHTYETAEFYKVNAEGSKNLIEALKNKYQNKLHFILVSSLAAAGPTDLGKKKDEIDIDFPVSHYGRSKKEAEEIVKSNAPLSWITSIVRPPMIIGPGDTAVLDIFKMVRDGFILLPGIRSKIKEYSFVCVFDLIETITLLLKSEHSLLVYSANPTVIQFQQLIREIKKQLKKSWIVYIPLPLFLIKIIATLLSFIHKFFPHKLRLTPDKILELGPMAWTCDSKRSETELNQTYQYDLKQTVEVTLHDYQKRKWI